LAYLWKPAQADTEPGGVLMPRHAARPSELVAKIGRRGLPTRRRCRPWAARGRGLPSGQRPSAADDSVRFRHGG